MTSAMRSAHTSPSCLLLAFAVFTTGCPAGEPPPCPVGTARRSDGACLRGCRPDEVNDRGGCNCPPPLVERRVDGQLFCEFVEDGGVRHDGGLEDIGPDVDEDAPSDECVAGEPCEPDAECQVGAIVCDGGTARCVPTEASPDESECSSCATGSCTCRGGSCTGRLDGRSAYLKPEAVSAFDLFGGEFGQGLAINSDGSTLVAGAYQEASSRGGVDARPDDLLPSSGAAYVFDRDGEGWVPSAFLKAPAPESFDRCGTDVAISSRGDVVAMSCPQTGANGGVVHIFRRAEIRWEFDTTLSPPRPTEQGAFGAHLAIADDGRVVAVGSPGESSSTGGVNPTPNELSSSSGAVFVFRRSGEGWSLDAMLKAPVPEAGSRLSEVALSADATTLVASAASETAEGLERAGAAYFFSYSPSRADRWRFEQRVVSPAPELRGAFGTELAVSRDGRALAIAAHREDSGRPGLGLGSADPVQDSGAAYIFRRDASTFGFEERFKLPSISPEDNFGTGIALADGGNAFVVGAPGESTSAPGGRTEFQNDERSESGLVAVYRRISGRWEQTALLKHARANAGDRLGSAIAVTSNGDTVVATAPGDDARIVSGDGEAADSGALYVFR